MFSGQAVMLCTQSQGDTADQSYNLEVVSMRRTGDIRQPARHVVVSLVRLAKSLHATAEAVVPNLSKSSTDDDIQTFFYFRI